MRREARCGLLIRLLGTLLLAHGSPSNSQIVIEFEEVASGFSFPVFVTHAGDGSGRLFVVERRGRIRIVDSQGQVLEEDFLNLGPSGLNRVASSNDIGDERGLLGLAFHPDYPQNGRFFVHYSLNDGFGSRHGDSIIAEYSVSEDPNVANVEETIILGPLSQPFGNHNGGMIAFNPFDGCPGCLYIALGDGGFRADPLGHGQNTDTLLGSILRIDINSSTPTSNYGVPADNPFVGAQGADEIYAYGLRNPWRFSFDRANGRLFVGDVGQDEIEEISLAQKGDNLGWVIMEGSECFNPPSGCDQSGLTLPIAEYPHSIGNVSVTGGYVYRGSEFPSLSGLYLFADYNSGRLWTIEETAPGVWGPLRERFNAPFLVSSFGEGPEGEIYVVEFSSSNGKIHRITDAALPPTSAPTSTPSSAPVPTPTPTPSLTRTPTHTHSPTLPPPPTLTMTPKQTRTFTSQPTIQGDLTGDQAVNGGDIVEFLRQAFGQDPRFGIDADLDQNSGVGAGDLWILGLNWQKPPDPTK